ncbi:hypothetical protein BCY86_03805 [Pajaroellobacter abortibovis]|uniref:Cation transporter n=2 Tax=Pajaroellobacter abortibovis TaxID=1882918 RepID=A0A1L6MWG7_9BACT|nr:hypothetical protein BCY86_03805 [Pajaroellobacter abortibovis]
MKAEWKVNPPPQRVEQTRRLLGVTLLLSVLFFVELAAGLYARSRVLQADAVHLLMDVFLIGINLLAVCLATWKPSARFTYGLRRAEPLTAIFSVFFVLELLAHILAKAVEEVQIDAIPESGLMLWASLLVVCTKVIGLFILRGTIGIQKGGGYSCGTDGDLNVRGVRLHMLGDILGSGIVLITAITLQWFGKTWIDGVASFAVAFILFLGTFRLLWDAFLVLLEAAPSHLSIDAIYHAIKQVVDVCEVHDLHVWTLGADCYAISVHVKMSEPDPALAARLARYLKAEFSLSYATVQVELPEQWCSPSSCPGPDDSAPISLAPPFSLDRVSLFR